jgi:GNAT superfamily N-acetyltransferase
VTDTAVTLRAGVGEDAGAIAEIWHLGWRDAHLGHVPQALLDVRTEESFRARARQRAHEATVAVVDGAVGGFVIVVVDEVEQVYVAAARRGSGLADLLMAEAERRVRDNGHDVGWLAVVAGNARARRFYERRGWRDDGLFDYEAATEAGPVTVPCRRYTKRVRR